MGNTIAFEVECTKDIKNIQVFESATINGLEITEHGVHYKINRTGDRTLKGSARDTDEFDFLVIHTDGSASKVIVKK